MTKKDLLEWWRLQQTKEDQKELIRLNHLVMEVSHKIHNKNMLDN